MAGLWKWMDLVYWTFHLKQDENPLALKFSNWTLNPVVLLFYFQDGLHSSMWFFRIWVASSFIQILHCSFLSSLFSPCGRTPCPWQRGGTSWSLRSFPTQTVLWLWVALWLSPGAGRARALPAAFEGRWPRFPGGGRGVPVCHWCSAPRGVAAGCCQGSAAVRDPPLSWPNFQGWGIHNLSGKALQVPFSFLSKEFLPK